MKNDIIDEWIKKAENDLLNAETVVKIENPPTDTICFHAQQCAEKYLKAYLISKNVEIIRTHNLRYLLEECKKFAVDFESLREDAIILNSYSIETRYPGDFIVYSISEAKNAIKMAKKIKKHIIKKLEGKNV